MKEINTFFYCLKIAESWTPYPSVLDFLKIKFDKLDFNLQKSISKLIFAGYAGSKNPVRNRLKIQFVELDFSKIKYRLKGREYRSIVVLLHDIGTEREAMFWA
jgi:hypothetical protein